MAEKNDLSSAYRRLKSPNSKTRDRALKLLKEIKAKKSQKSK
ncbi:putative metal homeostasis protein [Leuconostoc mesenteroides]|nr:putative metal homeostasis protein [Leuconostoc mesenteroides]